MSNETSSLAIDQLLRAFEAGSPALLDYIDDQIDLAIDHYQDDADISWQRCRGKMQLLEVLARLGQEVFPQGTTITHLSTTPLGNDWYLTQLQQRFWYGVDEALVKGTSLIISHENNGKVDYFRETVQAVDALAESESIR